jgi:hypothetical protein
MERMVDDIVRIGKITSRSTRMFLNAVKNVDTMVERIESLMGTLDEVSNSEIPRHALRKDIQQKHLKNDMDTHCVHGDLQNQIKDSPTTLQQNIIQQGSITLPLCGISASDDLNERKLVQSSIHPSRPMRKCSVETKVEMKQTSCAPISGSSKTSTKPDEDQIVKDSLKQQNQVSHGQTLEKSTALDERSQSKMKRQNLLLDIQNGAILKNVQKEESFSSKTIEAATIPPSTKRENFLLDIRNRPALKSTKGNEKVGPLLKESSSSIGHQGKLYSYTHYTIA